MFVCREDSREKKTSSATELLGKVMRMFASVKIWPEKGEGQNVMAEDEVNKEQNSVHPSTICWAAGEVRCGI